MKIYQTADVLKISGMSEKRLRNYVEKELVKPLIDVRKGISRSFSEGEYLKFPMLVALSDAGFTYEQMKQLMTPNSISDNAEYVEKLLKERIEKVREEERRATQSVARLKALQLAGLAQRSESFLNIDQDMDLSSYFINSQGPVDDYLTRQILKVLGDLRFQKALAVLAEMNSASIPLQDPTVNLMAEIVWNVCLDIWKDFKQMALVQLQALTKIFEDPLMEDRLSQKIGHKEAVQFIANVFKNQLQKVEVTR